MNLHSKYNQTIGFAVLLLATCLAAVGQTQTALIEFPTLQPGATAVQWVELPAGTAAVSGTVTGPFAIALQASYDYGSIDGISFASSAVTNGVCSPDAKACGVYLGVEFLGAATPGSSTGTVTLDNGLIYSLSANVLGPGLILTPSSIDGGSVPIGSKSDGYPITITNVQSAGSADIALDPPTVSGPFSITSNCGASLAASQGCSITVFFSPTAVGAATGKVRIPTSVGILLVSLTGTGLDNPADVEVSPATIIFAGDSAALTVTLTNLSSVDSVQAGALIGVCFDNGSTYCVRLVANNCATIAPLAACQIQLQNQGADNPGILQIPLTPSSSTTASTYTIAFNEVSPPPAPSSVLAVSPSALQFPAAPFGQPSAPLTVTVTNHSQTIVSISAGSITDFIIDPSCGPLLPGKSCTLSVRYLPTSGIQQGSGQLTINAFDLATVTTIPPFPPPLGSVGISVSGFGTPDASVASPSYQPLIQPVNVDLTAGTMQILNTSTTPLVLGSIATLGGPFAPGPIAPDATGCTQPIPPGGSCTVNLNLFCPDLTEKCQIALYSNALSSPDVYQVIGQQGFGMGLRELMTNFSLGVAYFGAANAVPFVFPQTGVGASTAGTLGVYLQTQSTGINASISLVPSVSSDFTIDNQCPAVLVPHITHPFGLIGRCNVVLTFAPKTVGFHFGTITFNTNLGLWTFPVAGTAPAPPDLQVTPANLLLGALAGQTPEGTVTLKNASAAALSLTPAALGGPQAADFKISQTTCGPNLAAGATCTIQVTYTNPESLSSAELILPSGKSDVQTVALTGVIPQLLVDGTAVSLQLTSIGDQTHHLSTVTSFQGAPVTIQSVTITGTNPSDFTIAANSCTPGLVLQGTMSCVIDIAFAPHETGGLVATVDILSSAGTTPIYLYSVGALGPAQVSPTALMFGNQDLLIPSTAQLITVTNPDPVALTLPALPALSGANPSDFTISGSCTTIPANSPCSLKVAFTPTATGTRTASLTIGTGTTVDPNSGLPVSASTTVTFTGVGVASGPPANVHPMRLHFHPRLVGSVSEARKIFLHNPGTTTLILAAPPTITGADPLDFRLSGACTSIAAGGLCELGVQFKPTVEGNRSATLSIPTGGIANRSAQVLLEGNGCVAHHWRPHDHDEGGCEERGDEERDADHR